MFGKKKLFVKDVVSDKLSSVLSIIPAKDIVTVLISVKDQYRVVSYKVVYKAKSPINFDKVGG